MRAVIAGFILLLGGCASAPRIFTNEDPDADFSAYATYAFQQPLGTDRSDGLRTPLSQYLIDAVSSELDIRGYSHDAESPSMVVNFYLNTEDRVDSYSVPTTGYYGYRRSFYGGWGGYETHVYQYTQGTLSIDLVDPRRKTLIWEGIAEGELTDKARENLQASIDDTVSRIFQKYPHTAGADATPAN